MIRVLIFGVNSLPHVLDTFARGLYIYPIMTTSPIQTALSHESGIRHHRCAACDGEGVDLDSPDSVRGGYDDCGRCHGTGDAPCARCDQPEQQLSSEGYCEWCASIKGIEDELAYPPAPPLGLIQALVRAANEWALYRHNRAKAPVERTSKLDAEDFDLPF